MSYSAIILAGGASKRFGEDKGLIKLMGKPLVRHVSDKVLKFVDEIIVVTSTKDQLRKYSKICDARMRLVLDEYRVNAPLIGAVTGFKMANGKYSLLLPCDTPLISEEVVSLLLDLAPSYDAVIPRWPSGYIEPLQSVYKTGVAFKAAKEAVEENILSLRAMIAKLKRVLYISTMAIKSIDQNLFTFLNVNNQASLRRAECILESKAKRRKTC